MAKIVKVIKTVCNAFLVLLIIIGVFIGVTLLPFKNNFKLLAVTSGSMEPAIGVGSLAIIKPTAVYKVGDIITYKRSGATSDKETTTHRVAEIVETNGSISYITKGDANNSVDSSTVNQDQIVGKYRFSVALLGYAMAYLKTLPGLVLIIIIPATIIIYEEIRKIAREAKGIKSKRGDNKEQVLKKEKK